ncbi:hypothetical protein IQ243_08650 [Nostocales cyanobacterium LEGE 11386]|nr:hypothetical protein [Nostocales cyanobacterium LEGE 11386]
MTKLAGILAIYVVNCTYIKVQNPQKYQSERLGCDSMTICQYVEILMAPMNANQEKEL